MFDTRLVTELDATVSALRGADFAVATTSELDGVLRGVLACADALVGVQARAVAAFEAHGGHETDGCARMSGWLRRELRLTAGEVRRMSRTAQTLAALPKVAVAFDEGQVRPAHVDEFGDGLSKMADDTMRAAQDLLLPVARSCDPADLRRAIEHLHHVSDADADDEAWVAAQERQDINCRRAGHGWVVNGFLDAETGAMFSTALKAWGKPRGDLEGKAAHDAAHSGVAGGSALADSAGEAADAGTGAAGPANTADTGEAPLWPVARRRVDGLKTLLAGYLGSGSIPTDKGVRPHLNITVDHQTLLLALRGDRTAPTHQPAVLAGYGYTGRDLIARLACDSTFNLTLVDATTDQHRHGCSRGCGDGGDDGCSGHDGDSNSGTRTDADTDARATSVSPAHAALHPCGCRLTPYVHVLDVGRDERLATPRQRQAVLTAQGQRCAAPGCNNAHLEIHHIVAWADGGPTDVSNLVGLCSPCHTLLHRGLLQCSSDGHGGASFSRSDGMVISDVRRRALADYARDLRDAVSADLITQQASHADRERWRRQRRRALLGHHQRRDRHGDGQASPGSIEPREHRKPHARGQGASSPEPSWFPYSSLAEPPRGSDGRTDNLPPAV
jgi:hypothetical protein